MTNRVIVLNLATTDTNHLCGILSKEIPHDDPEIVDIVMRPAIQGFASLRKASFPFLKEGENFIKKTLNGQSVYIIFRDSGGNSAIYRDLAEDHIKTIAKKDRIINDMQLKINSQQRIIDKQDEDQDTKDFKKEQIRRSISNVNRSPYLDRSDFTKDNEEFRGF